MLYILSSGLNLSDDQKSDLFTHFFPIPSPLAITNLFYEFGFLFQIPYISEIIWYFLSLFDLFSIMPLKSSIHVVT